MADSNSGPLAAVNSLVNGAVGIVKQVLGIVLNRGSLQEEGKESFNKSWEELLGSVRSELEKAGENK